MNAGLLGLAFLLSLVATSSAENVALGKGTEQTGQFRDLSSDRAVDGEYGTLAGDQMNCAHPNSDSPAEWKVDLGGRYTITTIILYNTYDDYAATRLGFLKVNVLDDAGLVAECGDKSGNGTIGEVWTTNCPADVTGRYVQVVRYGGFQIGGMTLCEVEVTGQLYEGRQIECNGSSVVPWAVVGVVTGLLLASLGVNIYCWRRSKSRAEKPSSHHANVNSDVITPPVTRADPEYELTDDVKPRLRNSAYNDIHTGRTGPYEDLVPCSSIYL